MQTIKESCYFTEPKCLPSNNRFVNTAYEQVKQKTYTQNLFPTILANLIHLDIFFAKF